MNTPPAADSGTAPLARSSRLLLGLAAVAIAFAAADTYVVVLALPDMMSALARSRLCTRPFWHRY